MGVVSRFDGSKAVMVVAVGCVGGSAIAVAVGLGAVTRSTHDCNRKCAIGELVIWGMGGKGPLFEGRFYQLSESNRKIAYWA